jgi:hypothetical protein
MAASSWPRRSIPIEAVWLVLSACLLGTRAEAQMFHVVSARGEIYSLAALHGVPPVEMNRVSPDPFTSFADSTLTGWGNDGGSVTADVEQIATIRSDSIYIHQWAYADMGGRDSQIALTKSDTSIRFTVDPGRRFAYDLWGELWTENPGSGTSTASFSLTRVGGAVITSLGVQVAGGPPTQQGGGFEHRGVLEAGDYVYECHTSANANYGLPSAPAGRTDGELWAHLWLSDITTAISPSSWAHVKSLFK